MAELNQY